MELLNGSLSVVMHVFVAAFLLVYLPISLVWRLLRWALVRPFLKEDMTGKVVLITGASSGIGEVSDMLLIAVMDGCCNVTDL